jgi:predicted dinucleotide-binding enzyme
MCCWPPIDGVLPECAVDARPSSSVLRDALPSTARLVRTFNHLGCHQLEVLRRRAGAQDRTDLTIR